MADWEWWFTSEWGRDQILRDQVEDLRYSASAASQSASRLRSQLTRLEGSLETRLTALSAAFDAYVELGDVREQLGAYADTGAVRRLVRDAFKTMTEGGRPAPVVDEETDYWLAPATNSVIAILAGRADPDAEALARDRLPQSQLFVVAAAGGLERGAAVADRVPALFDRSGEPSEESPAGLDRAQRTVFAASALGVYPGVLAHLAPFATVGLADTDVADTLDWVGDQTGSADPQTQLEWIEKLFDPGSGSAGSASPAAPAAAPRASEPDGAEVPVDLRAPDAVVRDGLRAVVVEMIEAGTGTEAELLRRAKVLRARIENPGADQGDDDGSGPGQAAARERVPWVVAVREKVLDPAVGAGERAELLRWLQPSLLAAVDALGVPPNRSEPVISVRTPGGAIDVGPTGPSSQRHAQVMANLTAEAPSERSKLLGATVATGALAVLALVLALVNQIGVAAVLLVAAVVVGVIAVRMVLARSARRREQSQDAARIEEGIGNAVRKLQQQQQAERASDAALQQSYERVRTRLGAVSV